MCLLVESCSVHDLKIERMGKVKNSKKYRKKLTERSNPLPSADTSRQLPEETKNLSSDLASLDVKRRERACVILGEILANYSNNYEYFEKICNSDILNKLCLRLVDSNLTVRLHAAGAVRNMSSSKFPVIARRMVEIGMIPTIVTLVKDTLNSVFNETSLNYIEQLITAISNLCAACELTVTEILQRQFLEVLFQIIQSENISAPVKAASACCIYTATDGHLECCSHIFNNSTILPILLSTLSFSLESHPKLTLTRLYCVGSLSNIYLSFLSNDSQPDVSLLTEIRQKMQQVLSVVLSSLSISDEILSTVTSSSIDTSTNNTGAPNNNTTSTATTTDKGDDMEAVKGQGAEDAEGEEGEGGGESDKLVFVAGDVDRSWTAYFDVIEVAAEILANMACLVRNTVLKTGPNADGEVNEEDWSDNEEDEQKMEQIASSTKTSSTTQTENQTNINDFDTNSAISSCISFIEKINMALNTLIEHAQSGDILTSPVIELLVSADRIFSALHNISFLIDSQSFSPLQFANTLFPSLQLLNGLCNVFAGVTLSNSDQSDGSEKPSSEAENSAIHMWSLSPLLDSQNLESTLRSTIFSCLNWILSLHSSCGGNPITLGLIVEGDERFAQLRAFRLSTILKVISDIPLFEAMRSCLDIISMLAELMIPSTETPILTPEENYSLTQALLQRLAAPGAIVSKESMNKTTLVDASTMVMEGCISCLIDLHSSDNLQIYQVFINLQTLNILRETSGIFRNKLKGESSTMERSESQRGKETLLNLNRFIKYKSTPPK